MNNTCKECLCDAMIIIDTGERCCYECGVIDDSYIPFADAYPSEMHTPRERPKYSRKKYFIKTLEKYINIPNVGVGSAHRSIIERDFDIQEKYLEKALHGRKKSINVWYKLYKLLQHLNLSVNRENFLLPSDKKIMEYEDILVDVWDKVGWKWVEF